jgi:signal transduction histidine kinase
MPVIKGYEIEIRLLFQNLISNAIKFRSPESDPVIRITCRKIDNFWEFAIADNGIGIAQEHQEKIFIIFQRLHLKSQYEGSGIGLAHCKKIVELHGGNIWVESEPYKGSKFIFTLME